MAGFLARRLFWAVFLVYVATTLTFVLFWIIPPDPASLHSGLRQNEAYVAQMRHFLHLDQPLWRQYLTYLGNVLHGSFGRSLETQQSVGTILMKDAPVTGSLLAGGAVIWLVLGLGMGVVAARRPRSLFDRGSSVFVLIGVSAHPVWIGLLLSYVFGYRFPVVPIAGYCDFFGHSETCRGAFEWWYHLVLPWITFSALFAALYVRLIRAGMIEALGEDYVRGARAKGASEWRVTVHHALRNSMLPFVTVLGMDLGLAVGAAIFTEIVFGLPGLGAQLVHATRIDDEPVIIGIMLFTSACVVVANVVVDLVYAFLDPRVMRG